MGFKHSVFEYKDKLDSLGMNLGDLENLLELGLGKV